MSKVTLGPQTLIYPKLVLLIGANVNDKPNFMVVAHGGIVNSEPPIIAVSIHHSRYTDIGIRQNMTFSVNVPSRELIKETDYCGLVSGEKIDKAAACRFQVFYGKLKTAPLIEQYPVNLECKVTHIMDLGSHSLVLGKIEETYVSEEYLTDGKPDVDKIKPLIFVTAPARNYRAFGEVVAKAYSVGQEFKSGK